MERSDFVIIGGVAAGPKTAAVLARRKPQASITLFQNERHLSYDGCGLPYFASGEINSFDELMLTPYRVARTPDFFENSKGFRAIIQTEVVSIDRTAKTVTVRNIVTDEKSQHGYGKLVIATGARPKKPPFPIAKSPNIRAFTRPDDASYFRQMAQQGKISSVAIIGGGFIGCELAEAARSLWGMEATLIEKENQILPCALDPEMARLVQAELKRQNIKVMIGCHVNEIEQSSDGKLLIKTGADNIQADFVFLCLGVKPEIRLAEACGLAIGETGAIAVNDHLQTSDPDIYAGGDCIESTHRLTGRKIYLPMGSLANRHGRVIAENLAGGDSRFPGVLGSFLLKVFDLNIGAVGLSEQAARTAGLIPEVVWGTFPDRPDYYPDFKILTAKMVYDNNSLLGLQAVGAGDICRRIDVFSSFLQHNGKIEELLDFEAGYAPPYAEALDPLQQLASIAIARNNGVYFLNPSLDSIDEMANPVFLDLRELHEVEKEPLPSSCLGPVINIPLNDLGRRLGELHRHNKIILACGRGSRSYQAFLLLKNAGFKNISVVGGGTKAMVKQQ